MKIDLAISGSTDKTVRAVVIINGTAAGELQMLREEMTRFQDMVFGKGYTVSAGSPDYMVQKPKVEAVPLKDSSKTQ